MSAPEDDEAPHTILDISTDSFVNVLLHVGAGARPSTAELCRLSGVCSGFRSTLADEGTWQILCKWAWSVDEADLSSDWPRLASFRSLYAVLEEWAPRQGFHQLLDAYPWGALLLLSFRQGLFVGELIFHEPPSEEGSTKCVAQPPVRALEVDFGAAHSHAGWEDHPAFQAASGQPPMPAWMEPATRARMSWLGLPVAGCRTTQAHRARPVAGELAVRFFGRLTQVPAHCRQYLEVTVAVPARRNSRDGSHRAPWNPGEGGGGPSAGRWARRLEALPRLQCVSMRRLEAMLRLQLGLGLGLGLGSPNPDPIPNPNQALLRQQSGSAGEHEEQHEELPLCAVGTLTLGLVDGPSLAGDAAPADAGRQGVITSGLQAVLRPGLYVGDYEHRFYGDHARETLLIERHTFDLPSQADGLCSLLRRDERTSAPLLAELQAAGAASCTLLVGRKVTGDIHVPMGAHTFVALLEPPLPSAPPPPVRVPTAAGAEAVRHGWAGYGTLAMPGFEGADWDRGWLVQLEDDPADGSRFAFVWESRAHDKSTVLTKVAAQNSAFYLGENDALRPYRSASGRA